MIKLNLGCGNDIKEGYINYDYKPINDKVKIINLNNNELPYDNNSVDEIILSHILEHLDYPHIFLFEAHRVLKKGGVLKINVPYHTHSLAVSIWQHYHVFTIHHFDSLRKGDIYNPEFSNVNIEYVFGRINKLVNPFCWLSLFLLKVNYHLYEDTFIKYLCPIVELKVIAEK